MYFSDLSRRASRYTVHRVWAIKCVLLYSRMDYRVDFNLHVIVSSGGNSPSMGAVLLARQTCRGKMDPKSKQIPKRGIELADDNDSDNYMSMIPIIT